LKYSSLPNESTVPGKSACHEPKREWERGMTVNPPPPRGIRAKDVDQALRALERIPVRALVDVEPPPVPLVEARLPLWVRPPRPPRAHGVEANEELVRSPQRREDADEGGPRSHEPGKFALPRSLPRHDPPVHGNRPTIGPRQLVAAAQSIADGLGQIPEEVAGRLRFGGRQDALDDGVTKPMEMLLHPGLIDGMEARNVNHGEVSWSRVVPRHSAICDSPAAVGDYQGRIWIFGGFGRAKVLISTT
jgi:hypothetical protein